MSSTTRQAPGHTSRKPAITNKNSKFLKDLEQAIARRVSDHQKMIIVDGMADRLSEEQKRRAAVLANEQFNMPLLSENWEYYIYRLIVEIAEAELYALLPAEVYAYLTTLADGITEEEAREGAEVLTYYLVQRIKTPIGNWAEEQVIGLIMRMLMKALIKNYDFNSVVPGPV